MCAVLVRQLVQVLTAEKNPLFSNKQNDLENFETVGIFSKSSAVFGKTLVMCFLNSIFTIQTCTIVVKQYHLSHRVDLCTLNVS